VTRVDAAYYLVNKPVGVVSTAHDPQRRPTVVGLVPAEPRVFPVGRLDADTEGLLVLTNDGELAQLLAHPRHGVEKEYLAEVDGIPSRAALAALRAGVDLEDGVTPPARVTLVQPAPGTGDRTAALRIVVHAGRKRMVRRMCAAVGHPVRRLVRTRIGPLRDPSLAPGAWRRLEGSEVRDLYAAAAPGPGANPPSANPSGANPPGAAGAGR
jgi:23S rRNA pseudouridine2605 synthase